MFDYKHFVLNSIWNFYKAKFYYCDTEFWHFRLWIWLERHLVKPNSFQYKVGILSKAKNVLYENGYILSSG